jgi:eukaryotic-like serine/threonine-protein kinase
VRSLAKVPLFKGDLGGFSRDVDRKIPFHDTIISTKSNHHTQMKAEVKLVAIDGALKGKYVSFDDRTTCLIGRSADCQLTLPNDEAHQKISRFHCLLDINPPLVRVRDFGSLNGTYVNDRKIGQREKGQTPEAARKIQFPEYNLVDGDRLKLSDTVFQIEIVAPTVAPTLVPPPAPGFDFLELFKKWLGLAGTGAPQVKVLKGYKLDRLLGKGGFGAVYLAQNDRGKDVALKLMLPQIAANERAIEMFQREMIYTSMLDHPHVVKVLDKGYADGVFFLVMEYCNGGNVEELRKSYGGKLPIKLAVDLISQVLDGLEYTHNLPIDIKLPDGDNVRVTGIVHRDLKPHNLFLDRQGDRTIVKIGDYGLAKSFDLAGLSGLTCSGNVMGTPYFMCRQQAVNFKYAKPDCDIWAVAASLYYLITGAFPRDIGENWFGDILKNPPMPIRSKDASIPKSLADVLDRALVEEPELHFKTAKSLKAAIEQAID